MIRYLVFFLLAAALLIFAACLGGGMGYAQGGGTVRILTDEVTASSETGQAIAIWENNGEVNAQNVPQPKPVSRGGDMSLFFFIIAAAILLIGGIAWKIRPGNWDDDEIDDTPHHSWNEQQEKARKYGP